MQQYNRSAAQAGGNAFNYFAAAPCFRVVRAERPMNRIQRELAANCTRALAPALTVRKAEPPERFTKQRLQQTFALTHLCFEA